MAKHFILFVINNAMKNKIQGLLRQLELGTYCCFPMFPGF